MATATTSATFPISQTQAYFLGLIGAEGFDPTWQHVRIALRLGRALDPARIAEVITVLEDRHAVLGTRLTYVDGEPALAAVARGQAVHELDLRDARAEEIELCVSRCADLPFDLLHGPLWRVTVAHLPADAMILQIVCHHLVADGLSTWILLREFGRIYFGEEIESAPPTYEAFVESERTRLDGPEARARLEYWDEELRGARPRLELQGRPDPGQIGAGDVLGLRFPAGAGDELLGRARGRRVTPLALLLCAAIEAARRASGQDDVVAASVTDVRGAQFARTVGAFSDLVFVRDRHGDAGGDDPASRLLRIRNCLFNGWRQHLPVAYLRDHLPALQPGGETIVNPCDVYLNFLPVRSSSDWWEMIRPFADDALDYFVPRQPLPSPSRRRLAPLLFFLLLHARDLDGSLAVHRSEPLTVFNRTAAEAMEASIATLLR